MMKTFWLLFLASFCHAQDATLFNWQDPLCPGWACAAKSSPTIEQGASIAQLDISGLRFDGAFNYAVGLWVQPEGYVIEVRWPDILEPEVHAIQLGPNITIDGAISTECKYFDEFDITHELYCEKVMRLTPADLFTDRAMWTVTIDGITHTASGRQFADLLKAQK